MESKPDKSLPGRVRRGLSMDAYGIISAFAGAIVFAAAIFVYFASTTGNVSTHPSIGRLSIVEKNVLGRNVGDSAWRKQMPNGVVFNEDEIFTGEGAYARVDFEGGGRLTVEEKSLVRIRVERDDHLGVGVERGSILADFPSGTKNKLTLNVGGKSTTQNDERLTVRVIKDGTGTTVAVLAGEVQLNNGKSPTTVKSGDVAAVNGDQAVVTSPVDTITLTAPAMDSRLKSKDPFVLSWQGSSNSFFVEIAADMAFSRVVKALQTSETTVSINNLNPGRYFWRVSAHRGGGTQLTSYRAFVVSDLPAIALIWPRQGQLVTGGLCPGQPARPTYLAWRADDSDSVSVEISRSADFSDLWRTFDLPTSPLQIGALEEGAYFWRVVDKQNGESAVATFVVQQARCEKPGLAALPLPEIKTAPVELTPIQSDVPLKSPTASKKPRQPKVASIIHLPAIVFDLAVDTSVPLVADLGWRSDQAAVKYQIQISKSDTFETIFVERQAAAPNAVLALPAGVFHARVRGYGADDAPGAWTATASFRVDAVPMVNTSEPVASQKTRRFSASAAYMPSLIDYQYKGDGIENNQRMLVERGAVFDLKLSFNAVQIFTSAHFVYDPNKTADEDSNEEAASGNEGLGIYREFSGTLGITYHKKIENLSWDAGLAYGVESVPILTFGDGDDVGFVNATVNKLSFIGRFDVQMAPRLALRSEGSVGRVWSLSKSAEGAGSAYMARSSIVTEVMDGYRVSVGGIVAMDRLDIGKDGSSSVKRMRLSALVGAEVSL